ncbi:MAG: hypothetical protein NTW14_12520 [bacterium]|nr:hypothetical protein [bacterium]
MKRHHLRLYCLTLMFFSGVLALSSCGSDGGNNSGDEFQPKDHIAGFGSQPRFSPDGEKVAFGGDQTHPGIWVYTLSTQDLFQIVDDQHPHLYDYRWSPDGSLIAFGGAGATVDSTSGIYVVGLDGSEPHRWNVTGKSPSWLPDQSGLIFEENNPQANLYGVFKLTFADTSLLLLTNTGTEPLISPLGDQVAYRDPGSTQYIPLKVVSISGGASVTVADTCIHFTWTVDGVNLVFDYVSSSGGVQDRRISRVPASGSSDPVKIVSYATQPTISSDNVIAYQRINQDLSQGIYTVNLSGSDITQVAGAGSQPDFSPDGSHIAFADFDGIWVINL